MTRHVSATALARFRAGDLSQRKAARVSAHLPGCARCTDLGAELAGITMLLASTPAPPMPEHLAARIQDTLATEAASRVALDPGTEPERRDLPGRDAGPRRHLRLPALSSPVVLRSLAAAGAVIVIAGGGYLAISEHSTASTSQSAAAGRVAPAARPAAGNGARHAAQGSVPGTPTFGPDLHYGRRSGQVRFIPVSSGVNFVPSMLKGQVTAALSQIRDVQKHAAPSKALNSPATAAAPSPAPSVPAASQFGGVPVAALQGCVSRIAAGSPVLLVDVARYQGGRATIIVVAPAGSSSRQVWVVGPACSASHGDVIAHLSMAGG
jgi:hypothetical protein